MHNWMDTAANLYTEQYISKKALAHTIMFIIWTVQITSVETTKMLHILIEVKSVDLNSIIYNI